MIGGWRPMRPGDLDAVVAVARVAFPDHPEDRDCLADRLAVYPGGAWVFEDGGGVGGYLFAYPWIDGASSPLNSRMARLPDRADVIYLHDLALLPDRRGRGQARAGVETAVAVARAAGMSRLTLVAVNDAAAFWAARGFVTDETPEVAAKLADYGQGARFMRRDLEPPESGS